MLEVYLIGKHQSAKVSFQYIYEINAMYFQFMTAIFILSITPCCPDRPYKNMI